MVIPNDAVNRNHHPVEGCSQVRLGPPWAPESGPKMTGPGRALQHLVSWRAAQRRPRGLPDSSKNCWPQPADVASLDLSRQKSGAEAGLEHLCRITKKRPLQVAAAHSPLCELVKGTISSRQAWCPGKS